MYFAFRKIVIGYLKLSFLHYNKSACQIRADLGQFGFHSQTFICTVFDQVILLCVTQFHDIYFQFRSPSLVIRNAPSLGLHVVYLKFNVFIFGTNYFHVGVKLSSNKFIVISKFIIMLFKGICGNKHFVMLLTEKLQIKEFN